MQQGVVHRVQLALLPITIHQVHAAANHRTSHSFGLGL